MNILKHITCNTRKLFRFFSLAHAPAVWWSSVVRFQKELHFSLTYERCLRNRWVWEVLKTAEHRLPGKWWEGAGHGLPHIIFLAMVGSWHCSVATKVMICAAMPKKAFHEGQHLLSESHAHALDKAATAAKAVCPLTPL